MYTELLPSRQHIALPTLLADLSIGHKWRRWIVEQPKMIKAVSGSVTGWRSC